MGSENVNQSGMGCTISGLGYPGKTMATAYRSTCSDPLSPTALGHWGELELWLQTLGESVDHLTPGVGPWSDTHWRLVADPSGGSGAFDRLPEFVASQPAAQEFPSARAWWSMSDNTLILNTLLDRGLCRVMHGHPLTLTGRDQAAQRERFLLWFEAVRKGAPFPRASLPTLHKLIGDIPSPMALVGGNLTAMERLGETPWRPHPRSRVLLLESFSCTEEQAPHRVAALVEDPWWEEISGLVLGRFTVADRNPRWVDRCLSLLPPDLPVARLSTVGHGADGWTIPLGEEVTFPR